MKTAFNRRSILWSAIALGMAGTSQNAAAVDIDQFNDPAFGPALVGTAMTPSPYGPVTANGGIGNFRRISATSDGPTTQVQISGGLFSHSQSSGILGTSSVVWGGSTGTGFSATDFTDGMTSNAIRVFINDTDANTAGNSLSIQLTDLGGSSASQSFAMGNAPGTVFYVDFLLSGFGGVDPEQITRVQMNLNGTGNNDWDIDVDSIATACSGNTTSGASGPAGGPPNDGTCEPPPPPPPPEIEHPVTVPAMTPLGLLGLGAGLIGIAGFFARRRK